MADETSRDDDPRVGSPHEPLPDGVISLDRARFERGVDRYVSYIQHRQKVLPLRLAELGRELAAAETFEELEDLRDHLIDCLAELGHVFYLKPLDPERCEHVFEDWYAEQDDWLDDLYDEDEDEDEDDEVDAGGEGSAAS